MAEQFWFNYKNKDMYTIIGVSGHVGSIVAGELLKDGQEVKAILRNPSKAMEWQKRGGKPVIADLLQLDSLKEAFRETEALFVMTPPAFDLEDPIGEHLKMLENIVAAIKCSPVKKVVYLSSIGGHLDHGTGAIIKLYDMEQKLQSLDIPTVGIRAGWFIENFEGSIESAVNEGVLHSFISPVDLKVPMIAVEDIGKLAATLIQEQWQGHRIVELAAQELYSAEDVAIAIAKAANRPITANPIPPDMYQEMYTLFGLTTAAAKLMAEMNVGFNSGHIRFENKDGIELAYGEKTLENIISQRIQKQYGNL